MSVLAPALANNRDVQPLSSFYGNFIIAILEIRIIRRWVSGIATYYASVVGAFLNPLMTDQNCINLNIEQNVCTSNQHCILSSICCIHLSPAKDNYRVISSL
jgi:hypothetical protein